MVSENTSPDMVFEASWEVTNKCGGIYTVVTSKIQLMQANYASYCLLGPLFDEIPQDFIQERPPEPYARAFAKLSREGIKCMYGTWDVAGRPTTILVDARSLLENINQIKTELWDEYQIDSLFSAGDFSEPLAWSWGVGKLLHALENEFKHNKIVGHFHEWLAGFALLYLKNQHSKVASVFTTHATMLGRTLASNDPELFAKFDTVDPEAVAKQYTVSDKFSTERACANAAHVFTTVSAMTAKECTAFFGRTPDVLPNGLEIDTFPTFEDTSFRHFKFKEKLYDAMMAQFFPHYTFDLSNTLFYYFGGRYEYKNKGFDILIESLARLNKKLIAEKSERTIVMLFLVAWNAGKPKQQLIENKEYLQKLTESVHEQADYFLQRIVLSALLEKEQTLDIIPPEFIEKLKRDHTFVKREGLPIMCTHHIDEYNDPTLTHLRRVGLTNNEKDNVKVVFMPAYLDGKDGLLNMEYYDVVSGCHLGVFPSYYEPWGYTPLESIAYGVPAVTTNTAGFGKYIEDEVVGTRNGLYVLDRTHGDASVVDQLYTSLYEFSCFSRTERIARKRNAHALSTYADWRQLIKYYLAAHCKAIKLVNAAL